MFIEEQDRVPLALALSLYGTPTQTMEGFTLDKSVVRAASWTNSTTQIIGIRGTYIGAKYAVLDESDDIMIARSDHCDLSIIKFAEPLINPDLVQIFVGHSLGGTAALCLTTKYPTSRGTSNNLKNTRYRIQSGRPSNRFELC